MSAYNPPKDLLWKNPPDENKPIRIRSTNEIIRPGKWIYRWEDDGDCIVYYTNNKKHPMGTQSWDVEILK